MKDMVRGSERSDALVSTAGLRGRTEVKPNQLNSGGSHERNGRWQRALSRLGVACGPARGKHAWHWEVSGSRVC